MRAIYSTLLLSSLLSAASADILGLAYGPSGVVSHAIEALSPNITLPPTDTRHCCSSAEASSPSSYSSRAAPGVLQLTAAAPEFDDQADGPWKIYARLALNDVNQYYSSDLSSPVDTVEVTVGDSTYYLCNNCSAAGGYDWFDALFLIHNVTAVRLPTPANTTLLSTPYIAIRYKWNLNANGDAYGPTIYAASCGAAQTEGPNWDYVKGPGLCWDPTSASASSNSSSINSNVTVSTAIPSVDPSDALASNSAGAISSSAASMLAMLAMIVAAISL